MALHAVYKSYLTSANANTLSENASLHYIPTLTTINTSAGIARHNKAHEKVLQKKNEVILNSIEADKALSLEIDTTIKFISGGGAYLPGLDDNFVADRTVIFPTVHVVQFDSIGKIQQIRIYWDQGSLLKQVEVVGARAKNWPIRDGKDQTRLIATSISSNEHSSRPSTAASSNTGFEGVTGKPRSESNNVTRDPHASLSLFASREENDASSKSRVAASKGSAKPPPRPYGDLFVGDESDDESRLRSRSPRKGTGVVPPKAQSAKPPPRDYHDLFVGEDSPNADGKRSESPSKSSILSPPAPKIGAGKNYKPSRLFETDQDDLFDPKQRVHGVKANATKYNHFEFGNGDDVPASEANRPKTKHQSQWDFEDFTTPAKNGPRARAGDQSKRHFGWENDQPLMDSPTKHPAVSKPRPDATSNFEFRDDGNSARERRPGSGHLGGTNVRNDALYDQEIISDEGAQDKEKHLSSIANVKERQKDFDSHYEITDTAPAHGDARPQSRGLASRSKLGDQSATHWNLTDAENQSTGSASKKGNAKLLSSASGKENQRGIKTAGDGMGARAGSNKENAATKQRGIKTGGDGMGGRAGSHRGWGFGDDSDN